MGPQKGNEVVDDVFGDAKHADFLFELRVERNPKTGKPNLLGPYAHGKPDERFLYLSWGVRIGPFFHGFRRAKIHLRHLDGATVEKALAANRPIEAIVKLTDKKGGPALRVREARSHRVAALTASKSLRGGLLHHRGAKSLT